MNNIVECPQCQHKHEVVRDGEEHLGPTTCQLCDFPFHIRVEVVERYYAICEEHDYAQWTTNHFICSRCGHVRSEKHEPKEC